LSNVLLGYDQAAADIERNASVLSMKRATSFTVVDVEETDQGEKSVEYFLASDARYSILVYDVLHYFTV